MQKVTWKRARKKTRILARSARKALKMGSRNLSSQKTESTIVLTFLQSPRWYPATEEEGKEKGTGAASRSNKTKVSHRYCNRSGLRAAPAARPRPRSGLAPLRCARTLQLASKQASKKKKRKEKKDKREKTEKKKDAQKEPNDGQQFCTFSLKLPKTYTKMAHKTTPNHRNDAGRVPLEARGVQKLKKQARTAP